MKKRLLMVMALCLFQQLSALSIGHKDNKYWEQNVQWQVIKYDHKDTGFTAAFPNDPTCSINAGQVFVSSSHADVQYRIAASISQRQTPPKLESQFIKNLQKLFNDDVEITPIPSNQKTVRFIAEIKFKEESKILRVFFSKSCLYWAIIEGDDLSLSSHFFESIKITK